MGCCVGEDHKNWCKEYGIVYIDAEGKEYCIFHAPADCKFVKLYDEREGGDKPALMDAQQFNGLVFERIDAVIAAGVDEERDKWDHLDLFFQKWNPRCNLAGTIFPYAISFSDCKNKYNRQLPPINFSNVQFIGDTNFSKLQFGDCTVFDDSLFIDNVNYDSSIFSGQVYFFRCKFNKQAIFANTQYKNIVYFKGSKFQDDAKFNHSKFKSDAIFRGVQFNGKTQFENSKFDKLASFKYSQINYAQFDYAIFTGSANFRQTQFNLPSSFNNIQFNSHVSFFKSNFLDIASFQDSTFNKETSFKYSTFCSEVNFDNSHFENSMFLQYSEFNGETSFQNCKFTRSANFYEIIFNGKASFSQTHFSGEIYFNDTQFCKQISFRKSKLKDADFNNATFKEFTNFRRSNFTGSSTIKEALFYGQVSFSKAKFMGNISFEETMFNEKTYFTDAKFNKFVTFKNVKAEKRINFSNVIFSNSVFEYMQFNKPAFFDNAKFINISSFNNAIFDDYVNFDQTIFLDRVSFKLTFFKEWSYFRKAHFGGETTFAGAISKETILLESVDLLNLKFAETNIESFKFIDCKWGDKRFAEIYDERHQTGDCNDTTLAEIYRRLKRIARESADEEQTSHWHYREKEMTRKNLDCEQLTPIGNILLTAIFVMPLCVLFVEIKPMTIFSFGVAITLLCTGIGSAYGDYKRIHDIDKSFTKIYLNFYKCISGYGEDPVRAGIILIGLVLLPFIIKFLVSLWTTTPMDWLKEAMWYMPLIKITLNDSQGYHYLLKGLSVTLITLQAALFGFALRNKLRR